MYCKNNMDIYGLWAFVYFWGLQLLLSDGISYG